MLVVIGGLLSQTLFASVTPASLAMEQVKAFLDNEVRSEIQRVIPPHKAANYLIQFSSNLSRGKFSEEQGGFSEFFGNTEVMVQVGFGDLYHEVGCQVSATTGVVPFAKQIVPILEEEVNGEQLVLKRHHVSCSVH